MQPSGTCARDSSWATSTPTVSRPSVGHAIQRAGEYAIQRPPGTAGISLLAAFSGKEARGPDFAIPWLGFGAGAYIPDLAVRRNLGIFVDSKHQDYKQLYEYSAGKHQEAGRTL